mgnify:CR=1 FL=1
MECRRLGNSDLNVSVYAFGAWQLGDTAYWGEEAETDAEAVVQTAIDAGVNLFDTAEGYGAGRSEEVLGGALGARRNDVYIASKVSPENCVPPTRLRAACEASLKRLRTDRIDLYLLHWRGSTPLQNTLEAFQTLQREGKIHHWGVSNFDTDDLNELLAVAGKEKIACNQVLYHLQERAIEHAVIPWCEQHGVAVVAYSPFGHNEFPSPRSPAGQVLQAVVADDHVRFGVGLAQRLGGLHALWCDEDRCGRGTAHQQGLITGLFRRAVRGHLTAVIADAAVASRDDAGTQTAFL